MRAREMRIMLRRVLASLDRRDLGDFVIGSEENLRILETLGYLRFNKKYGESLTAGLTP